MKETLEEFFEILKLDRQVSPWSRQDTFEDRQRELGTEVAEIGEALEKDDSENLEEELGDALWDLLFLLVIAEEQGLFTAKEAIQGAIDKIKRRKPWVFTGEKVSVEDEIERWQMAKDRESTAK